MCQSQKTHASSQYDLKLLYHSVNLPRTLYSTVCGYRRLWKQRQCSFTITVTDTCCNQPPTISCPADLTLCPEQVPTLQIPAVQRLPKEVLSLQRSGVDFCGSSSFQSACSTRIERTWTAVDPDHPVYTVHCVQTITLEDKTSPVFSSCPVNFTVDPGADCKAIVNWTLPTVSDNCGQVNLGFNYAPDQS